jgi:hypothetical protein
MNKLTEKEQRMLELIVELSAGDTEKILNRKATSAALGLTPSEGEKILKSLTSKRLIRYIIFGSLCITEAGVLWGRRQATKPQAKIFISYRRDDSRDITERIYDALASAFGRDCLFKDLDYKIPPGVDFPQYLHDVVKTSRLMLVIIGDNWFVHKGPGNSPRLYEPNDFVRLELEHAFQHDLKIIPILVAGASMPSSDSLPESLRPLCTLQAIEVRRDPDFHSDMDRVIASIRNCVP